MVRQTRAIRLYASAVVCAAAMLGAVPAHADDVAMAEKLFLEGKRLMDEEKSYERACEKFEAAYELDTTATGTLLNLALCHEQIKRTATAWAEFRQVVARSIGRREDRVALAREHEAKLAPVLSFITVDVAESARASGLRIEMDKRRPIAEASWGVELPVDPGKHVFEISAPGKVSRTLEIVVGDNADKQTIAIPVLADAPASPALPPSTGEPGVVTTDSGGARRTVGYVLGGLGIAALGTGAVFGVLAMNKNGDAEDAAARCPGNLCPNEAARSKAVSAIDDANANANIANVAVGAGIGLLAAGVVLVLTAKPTKSTASAPPALRIVPQPNGGTISFARAW